jgi:hypothetical protein
MDLAQVADELYGLSPAEFRAARDERVARARAAGDRVLAAAIGKLRRPTVSAWLVNQLAREAGDDLARLAGLGEQLREAQRAFAGERLRELSAPRREQVSALVRQAKRLAAAAGQAVSAQHEREVAATLEAALADPGAAEAVRSGWLASPLSHVGLGEGGPEQALAIPAAAAAPPVKPARRLRAVPDTGDRPGDSAGGGDQAGKPRAAASPVRSRPAGRAGARGSAAGLRAVPDREAAAAAHEAARAAAAAQRRARQVAEAERDLRDAEELAGQAGATLRDAEQRAVRARDRRHAIRAEIEQLERRLVEAQTEDTTAGRELREAQRNRDAAARSLEAAQRRVQRAKAKLEDLS